MKQPDLPAYWEPGAMQLRGFTPNGSLETQLWGDTVVSLDLGLLDTLDA